MVLITIIRFVRILQFNIGVKYCFNSNSSQTNILFLNKKNIECKIRFRYTGKKILTFELLKYFAFSYNCKSLCEIFSLNVDFKENYTDVNINVNTNVSENNNLFDNKTMF